MTNFVKMGVLAALLALASAAAVSYSAPIADSLDAAVRDSTLIDLLNDPSILQCT